MDGDEPFLLSIDALLGGADEDGGVGAHPPGFGMRDLRQLCRMLFWPSLLSLALASWALLQGLGAS